MGIIAIPKTWADDDIILAADLNILNSTIYNEFNGNIDNANIKAGANIDAAKLLNASILSAKLSDAAISDSKIDYTSAKLIRAGSTMTGINGKRLITGRKSYTFAAGATVNNVVVAFATDSDNGDPLFTGNVRISGLPELSAGSTFRDYINIENITTTGFTFHVVANGASSETHFFNWVAIGDV